MSRYKIEKKLKAILYEVLTRLEKIYVAYLLQ